ncbi:MAG: GAF domain-containing protein, partial [Anaerolineales bacterium]
MEFLQTVLSPPVFEDQEKSRIGQYVHWLSLSLIAGAILLGLVNAFAGHTHILSIGLAATLILMGGLFLLRKGWVNAASLIVLLTTWGSTTIALAMGSGIHDIAMMLYPILIVVASFLLQRRGAFMMSVLMSLSVGALIAGELWGYVNGPKAASSDFADWVTITLIILIGAITISYMSDTLNRAVRQAYESEQAYAESSRETARQTELTQESEARWRTLIQNIPDNILNIDLTGKILLINLLEDNAQHMVGRSVFDITPPEQHETIRQIMNEIISTGNPATYEGYAFNAHGQKRWYAMRIAPIKDQSGLVTSIIVIATDISERLEVEQSLAKSEQAARQRAQQLATLNEISLSVTALQDLDTTLDLIQEQLQKVIKMDALQVALYDQSTNLLSFPLMYDSGQRWATPPVPLDPTTLNGKVLQTGQSFLVNRTPEEIAEREKNRAQRLGNVNRVSASMIFVPIIFGGQRIGIVSAHSYELNAYDESDVSLLEGAALQIGIAIQNARVYEAMRKRAEQLTALNQIGRSISSLDSLDQALQVTLAQMRRILPLDVFYVGLYNPKESTLSFPLMYDSGKLWNEPDNVAEPGGWIEQVLVTRQPLLINRTPEQIESAPRNYVLGDVTRHSASIIIAPMELDSRFIGVVSVQSYTLNAYTQEDVLLLSNAAGQIAIAVENARLYEETKHRAESMTALYHLGNVITSTLQLDGVMNTIYESCKKLLPLNAFYIATYDQKTDVIAHPIFFDQGKRIEVGPRIMAERPGLSGYIIHNKETVYIPDVLDPQARETFQIIHIGGDPTRSYLGVPLLYQGEAIGVISIQSDQPNTYTPEHISLLETISTQAAIALVNARLYEDLQNELRERQQAEEAVRALNAELEKRVQERTAELQSFTYTVSHDLRAPLRSINGYSRIFLEDYGHLIPPEGHELLNRISNGARQMGILIDDLLTFSRLNRASLNKTVLDLSKLARDIFDELTEHEDKSRIECQIADMPRVFADPVLIRQAITNLLSNALKFTRRRDIARIEMGAQAQDGEIVYYIRDNGAGFSMDHANKLFGVFQRLHHQEEFEGTGVGLAIVQRIVQQHGGRVWAEAEPDKGATFYF